MPPGMTCSTLKNEWHLTYNLFVQKIVGIGMRSCISQEQGPESQKQKHGGISTALVLWLLQYFFSLKLQAEC